MTTMMQMLGQMMWLPASLLARWMDLLGAMMRAQPCCQGREAMDWSGMAPGTGFPERGISGDNPSARGDGATKETKEERKMSNSCCCNNNCNDETVKLVEYTIVSIKPCAERVIKKGQVIYADDMNDDAFATWVVARYFQGDDVDECCDEDVTEAIEERREKEARRRRREIPSDDKKFLRVYHHVQESWPRPDDCCYDTKQLDILRGIEKAINRLGAGVGGEKNHHHGSEPVRA